MVIPAVALGVTLPAAPSLPPILAAAGAGAVGVAAYKHNASNDESRADNSASFSCISFGQKLGRGFVVFLKTSPCLEFLNRGANGEIRQKKAVNVDPLDGSWWDHSEKAFYHVVTSTDPRRPHKWQRVFATTCSTLLQETQGEDNLIWKQGDELHANGLRIRRVRIRLDESSLARAGLDTQHASGNLRPMQGDNAGCFDVIVYQVKLIRQRLSGPTIVASESDLNLTDGQKKKQGEPRKAIRKIYQQAAWSTPSSLTLLSPEDMEARGKYVSLDSVWETLRNGDTILVKGKWLRDYMMEPGKGNVLPKRQEIEKIGGAAYWQDVEELKDLVEKFEVFLMALSYCWKETDHPDREGEQMRTLSKILSLRFDVRYHDNNPVYLDAAMFIDWCSLYQSHGQSTATQKQSFQRGLSEVNLWYAHEHIEKWLLTKVPDGAILYENRGWPFFEEALSSIMTPDHMLLDIGYYDEHAHARWCDLFKDCKAGRNPPKVPTTFNEELDLRTFQIESDRERVKEQYSVTFYVVMGSVVELAFSNLDWIDEDAILLADTLQYCQNLEKIDLKSNDIGRDGAGAVMRAAAACPKLEVVSLTKNSLADAGAIAIASAMNGVPKLRTLWLNECEIGDDGIIALMNALKESLSIRNFYVFDNDIGDDGIEAVIERLPDCWFLMQMGIGGNKADESTIPRLQKAWAKVMRPAGHAIYVR